MLSTVPSERFVNSAAEKMTSLGLDASLAILRQELVCCIITHFSTFVNG